MTYEKAGFIRDQFIKKYWRDEYKSFWNGCSGISTVGMQDNSASDKLKKTTLYYSFISEKAAQEFFTAIFL